MGNAQSEFEEQFMQLYSFVGVIEDRLFHSAKIYRKNKFNFDYMMVVERPLSQFLPLEGINISPVEYVNDRLQVIRRFQNSFTTNLSYSIILEGRGIGCQTSVVKLFLEYFNHTLQDYLNALRANKLPLTIDELVFVAKSLAEGVLILRKMEIENFWLTLENVWVSAEQGKVVTNPVYFLYKAASTSLQSQKVQRLSNQFQPMDLATSHSHFFSQNSSLSFQGESFQQIHLRNILEIFLQITRYLSPPSLAVANHLFRTLKHCRSISELMSHLNTQCQELNVDQFAESKDPQPLYVRRPE